MHIDRGCRASPVQDALRPEIPNLTVELLLRQPWLLVTNPNLFFGYSLYGLNVGLLTLALRKGQLSLLYPVISLRTSG